MNIPQAMGYARIAGMPVITGLYTLLVPLVAAVSRVAIQTPPKRLSERANAGCAICSK
jgi:MFS superfamily sulfate permease-like transporter